MQLQVSKTCFSWTGFLTQKNQHLFLQYDENNSVLVNTSVLSDRATSKIQLFIDMYVFEIRVSLSQGSSILEKIPCLKRPKSYIPKQQFQYKARACLMQALTLPLRYIGVGRGGPGGGQAPQ